MISMSMNPEGNVSVQEGSTKVDQTYRLRGRDALVRFHAQALSYSDKLVTFSLEHLNGMGKNDMGSLFYNRGHGK